ncbi:uncharacterized protein FOMMEDRAFT_152686 [Fomitiporia mediterranea MF3/22]|uniref:uncharacterized protein n=1 Tax=Fomitiporia mediterranea (strain MF3/22) TaxID=694068 RepID=UPI00044090AA|nr:uncharacterized protein FOMMEDRAFT_152686 [Fomitiporia mediterranea MF3/22]EJD05384.1 hypothetical protein FOMMEDRAFT_152686 [Fomitiporia mediterranea MF3/22]
MSCLWAVKGSPSGEVDRKPALDLPRIMTEGWDSIDIGTLRSMRARHDFPIALAFAASSPNLR